MSLHVNMLIGVAADVIPLQDDLSFQRFDSGACVDTVPYCFILRGKPNNIVKLPNSTLHSCERWFSTHCSAEQRDMVPFMVLGRKTRVNVTGWPI